MLGTRDFQQEDMYSKTMLPNPSFIQHTAKDRRFFGLSNWMSLLKNLIKAN